MFTQRHYIAVAEVIAEELKRKDNILDADRLSDRDREGVLERYYGVIDLGYALADRFQQDSGKFKRNLFLRKAGIK